MVPRNDGRSSDPRRHGLSESSQKAGSAIYGAQPGEEGPIPEREPEGEGPAEEGTVEGGYREVQT